MKVVKLLGIIGLAVGGLGVVWANVGNVNSPVEESVAPVRAEDCVLPEELQDLSLENPMENPSVLPVGLSVVFSKNPTSLPAAATETKYAGYKSYAK
jgi:hypothetical protein